jgi:hypothetical protein
MKNFLERITTLLWNRVVRGRNRMAGAAGLLVGLRMVDEVLTGSQVRIPHERRATHIAFLGRTGTGKSSLLRSFCEQDIRSGSGFLVFDIHGELTPPLLSAIAAEERRLHTDLADRVIVIDPADPQFSVGMNPLEDRDGQGRFVRVMQFAEALKHRWGLQAFGARTDELLRNTLYVLAENGLTLVELAQLLADAPFRASCLKKVTNAEIRGYFELRYDSVSDAMQAVMREPVLNKVSTFTADDHFRHIVGQAHSTFSFAQAMDEGKWILVKLAKGSLGAEAVTLGALFLTAAKHAAYERRDRNLFTLYTDELQNFVGFGEDLETMLAEVRKFGVSVCTANQFLEQLPLELRAALLAIGTHIFFQLSPPDAQFAAQAFDGGKPLAERLKNLPPRYVIVKSGSDPLLEAVVPELRKQSFDGRDLYERSRQRWAKSRTAVEAEIASRRLMERRTVEEVLHDWE